MIAHRVPFMYLAKYEDRNESCVLVRAPEQWSRRNFWEFKD